MKRRLLIAAVAASGSVALIATMGTSAGPFDAQLSGRALQAQREHDFLFSSIRYMADEARDDEDERARVMSLLTAGGFSSGQLADAVYFHAKPTYGTGRLSPDALAGRLEIAQRMLAYGRTTYTPIDRDQLTMMNVEGMGLYVEIAGEHHVGDAARQIFNKAVESRRLAATWDRVEAAITELEMFIAEHSDDWPIDPGLITHTASPAPRASSPVVLQDQPCKSIG